MLTNILEFFREKKEAFVKTNVSREHYMPAYVDSDSGTYWPSQWDEVEVEEIDWKAFEQTVKELQGQKFFIKGKHSFFSEEEIKEYMQQREIYVADQHRSIKAQLDKVAKKYYSVHNLNSEK